MEQLMGSYVQKELVRADYIPAQPGYYRLIPWLGDDRLEYEQEAVVGWRVRTYAPPGKLDEAFTTCDPIVPQETVDDDDDHAILRPDGMVQGYDECVMPLDKWVERKFAELSNLEKRRKAAENNTP